MTDITWPVTYRPSAMKCSIATITSVFTSPNTGARQVLERDGQRWMMELTIPPGDDARSRAIAAILAKLRGPAGTLLVPFFHALTARGSLAGNPVLAAGSGRTLTVTGFTHSATGVLLAGDMIQTSTGRAHMVTEDVNADGSGNALVVVEPRLRTTVTAGALVTSNCCVRMNIISDDSFEHSIRAPLLNSFALKLVEDLS